MVELSKKIEELIQRVFEDPTHEMHISFSKLPKAHKWILFALLELDARGWSHGEDVEYLQERYDELCPPDQHKPFKTLLEELTEGFVQKKDKAIFWIHPSCRDLTVTELSNERLWRRRFLQKCSARGLELAVSVGGGAFGERNLPLLADEEDWKLFSGRCIALQETGRDIIEALTSAFSVICRKKSIPNEAVTKVSQIIKDLWPIYFEQQKDFPPETVRAMSDFFEVRHYAKQKVAAPGLKELWRKLARDVEWEVDKKWPTEGLGQAMLDFAKLVGEINGNEPKFFENHEEDALLFRIIDDICRKATSEEMKYDGEYADTDDDDLVQQKEQFGELVEAFEELAQLSLIGDERTSKMDWFAGHFRFVGNQIEEALEKRNKKNGLKEIQQITADRPEKRILSVESIFEDL